MYDGSDTPHERSQPGLTRGVIMPSGDDVTGLHAFDDLDPVSTVSALNGMPEPEAHPAMPQMISQPDYGAPSEPPPRPSSLPPPAPRAASVRPGAAAALPPPPPRGGLASASVPPPPAARRADDGEVGFDEEGDSNEDTK